MTFKSKLAALSVLTLSLAFTGCGPSEEQTPAQLESPAAEVDDREVSAQAFDGPCAPSCDDECVIYARCRTEHDSYGINLPYGLFSWADKKAIINSNHAHAGCVAMILGSNPAGHTAFVDSVNTAASPNRITLHESNWSSGSSCDARTGTKAQLNITNYWCPPGAHTSSCAGPL
ncbi:hypothetical protein [Corallococcus caeni]|uniref:CHAP domain-containing protein n=1 Tax=Corallococcus caeni TaxID=3082388 RepID=A0ABQ6R170_9BACT|nr:hypothetical protein ASNO1_63080 [Corallococcus sp. NO1]